MDDLILASHEAVANAIEHGDRRRGGHITLTAERTDDHVIITVTDHGR